MPEIKHVRTFEEFTQNPASHIERLRKTGEPEVLTVSGQPEVVVQSVEAYQKLLHEVDDLYAIRTLRQSYEEASRGEGRPARELVQEIAAAHGIQLPR